MSVARYRERHSTSGAKSDAADAHLLAEIVRLDRAHHRPVAGDTELRRGDQAGRPHPPDADLGPHPTRAAAALGVAGVLSRRAGGLRRPGRTRRARAAAAGTGSRPGGPADPDADHRRAQTRPPAPRRGPRHRDTADAAGAEQLRQPPVLQTAYAAIVASEVAIIDALNDQIDQLGCGGGRPFWPTPGR